LKIPGRGICLVALWLQACLQRMLPTKDAVDFVWSDTDFPFCKQNNRDYKLEFSFLVLLIFLANKHKRYYQRLINSIESQL